jgi:hypothetical protein
MPRGEGRVPIGLGVFTAGGAPPAGHDPAGRPAMARRRLRQAGVIGGVGKVPHPSFRLVGPPCPKDPGDRRRQFSRTLLVRPRLVEDVREVFRQGGGHPIGRIVVFDLRNLDGLSRHRADRRPSGDPRIPHQGHQVGPDLRCELVDVGRPGMRLDPEVFECDVLFFGQGTFELAKGRIGDGEDLTITDVERIERSDRGSGRRGLGLPSVP